MIFIEAEVPEQACRDSVVHTAGARGPGVEEVDGLSLLW